MTANFKMPNGVYSVNWYLNFVVVVELPGEPDGKRIDIHFVKEGNLDEAIKTPSVKVRFACLSACGTITQMTDWGTPLTVLFRNLFAELSPCKPGASLGQRKQSSGYHW